MVGHTAIPALHAGRRDNPDAIPQIEFRPFGVRAFVQSQTSQDQEPIKRASRISHVARGPPKSKKLIVGQDPLARDLLTNNAGRLQSGTWVDLDPISMLLDRPIEIAADVAERFGARAAPRAV